MKSMGASFSWKDLDEMDYQDYQILIVCIDAHAQYEARVKSRAQHYSSMGVQQAGGLL